MAIIVLKIHVDDVASVLGLFDRIEVFRSPTELGVYENITAETDTPAKLSGTVAGPWSLVGQILTVEKNGAPAVNIPFSGTNPLALLDVLGQINTVIPALASETAPASNKVALTSDIAGTASSLIASGTVAPLLGLPLTKVNGLGAKIQLTFPTSDYEFKDFDGDVTYWYKTRYFSSATQSFSSFSEPKQGAPEVVLPAGDLVKAKIHLTDPAGRPLACRRVIIAATEHKIGLTNDYAILPGFSRVTFITDQAGEGSIDLVRGARLIVMVEGTPYRREFIVPTNPLVLEFDLLTYTSTEPDPFTIAQAPPMPIRM